MVLQLRGEWRVRIAGGGVDEFSILIQNGHFTFALLHYLLSSPTLKNKPRCGL